MKLPDTLNSRRRKLFIWLVLNGLAQAAFGLAAVVAFERFHASGFSQGKWIVVLMGVGGCLHFSRILQRRHGEMFALDYVNETRLALMEKLLTLSDTARGASIGLVTARLSADLLALKSWLSEGLANSIVQAMTLAMLMAGALFIYPSVAVILACVIMPWLAAVVLLRWPLKEAIGAARKQRGKLASMAGDQVVARLTLAHFGRATSTLNAISRRSEMLAKFLIRRATLSESMRSLTEWALPVASLAALWVFRGGMGTPVPAATPLLLLLGMTTSLLAGLSRSIDLYLAHQLAIQRFAITFDAPGIASQAVSKSLNLKRGQPVQIVIRWTDKDGTVTTHSVPPGSIVSLDGGSSEERANVLAAMARLRDDPRFDIDVAGMSASEISIRDWRRIVTLVSPKLPLIRDTLGNNLSIGAPSDTSDEQVLTLARCFGIAREVEDMKSAIEPAHVPASRALAMRLCRGLIRKSSVILLDEAIAAPDLPMIWQFLQVARQRGITVITSGSIAGENGNPIGQPLVLPLARRDEPRGIDAMHVDPEQNLADYTDV